MRNQRYYRYLRLRDNIRNKDPVRRKLEKCECLGKQEEEFQEMGTVDFIDMSLILITNQNMLHFITLLASQTYPFCACFFHLAPLHTWMLKSLFKEKKLLQMEVKFIPIQRLRIAFFKKERLRRSLFIQKASTKYTVMSPKLLDANMF